MLQSEALTRLTSMLSPSSYPTLSAAEVLDLLNLARAADINGVAPDVYQPWAAAAAYAVGAYLVPTTRNGHYYRVTVSDGAAGAVEPTWPTTTGATVNLDGVTYQEAGTAPWSGYWALRLAAAEGYRWKAGKVASEFDFNSDVHGFTRSQMHKMLLEMADQYDNGVIGTMEIGFGALPWDPVIGNLNGGN